MTLNKFGARFDARQRAVRALMQGLVLDVATAVVLAASVQLGDARMTRGWWVALGAMLIKTAAMAAASYVHRVLGNTPAAAWHPDGAS